MITHSFPEMNFRAIMCRPSGTFYRICYALMLFSFHITDTGGTMIGIAMIGIMLHRLAPEL